MQKSFFTKTFCLLIVTVFCLNLFSQTPNIPSEKPDTGKAQYYQNSTPRKIRILNFNRFDSNVIGTRWFVNTEHSYNNAKEIKNEEIDSLMPSTANLGSLHYFVLIQIKNCACVSTSNIKTIEVIANPNPPSIAEQPSLENLIYCKNDKTTTIRVLLKNVDKFKPIYKWYISNDNDENNKNGVLIENAKTENLIPSTNLTGKHYYYAVVHFEGTDYTLTSNYSGSIVVYNNPKVQINTAEIVANKTIYLKPQTINIVSASGAQNYSWTPIGAVNNANATNTYLVNQSNTIYLTGTDENGCKGVDTLHVFYNQSNLNVIATNIISRNNDGLNDFFALKIANNFENKPIKLEIRNASAEIVYKSDDYHNNWFGADLNNNLLPSGAYEFTITIDNKMYKGPVSIVY